MVFFDARVVYFFPSQVRRSNSERVLQEIFSHRAIIYVMSTCICLFVASLCFLFFFFFRFNNVKFGCSRSLVSFWCLFSGLQVVLFFELSHIMPYSFSCVTVNALKRTQGTLFFCHGS